jgi:hypothetical protein
MCLQSVNALLRYSIKRSTLITSSFPWGPATNGLVGQNMLCKFLIASTYDYIRNTCLWLPSTRMFYLYLSVIVHVLFITWIILSMQCPFIHPYAYSIKSYCLLLIPLLSLFYYYCQGSQNRDPNPLESYDFTTLRHHIDPNPTMNPNLVESMLSFDPNHRILYNIAKYWSYFMGFPDSERLVESYCLNYSRILCQPPNLPHNPLLTSQAQNYQPIGYLISLKNVTISKLCTPLTNS